MELQLQAMSTQMWGELGLKVQSILGWSVAKGILSKPVFYPCPWCPPQASWGPPSPGKWCLNERSG